MNSSSIHPRTGDSQTVYLKQVVTDPNIIAEKGRLTFSAFNVLSHENWKNQFYFEFLWVLSYNEQQTLSYHWEDSYGVNSSYEL